MLDDLQTKIVKAGEEEDKSYKEYFNWCDDAASEARFSIKEATTAKEKAEATIAKMTADIEAAETSITELAASIAASEDEVKSATETRAKEAEEFAKVEAELELGVQELDGAIAAMAHASGSAALLQEPVTSKNVQNILNSLKVVLDAASLSTKNREKLVAFVQSKEGDEELDAPAAATYSDHTDGFMELLEDMKDKTETELEDARKEEASAKHNFDMLKQSLKDQIMADNHEKDEATETKAESEQTKGSAEGDLAAATKDLAHLNEVLETTSNECMTVAQDHEISLKGRAEELAALKKATEIVKEAISGAVSQTYSFLQIRSGSKLSTRAHLAKLEVVTAVKKLAKTQHSAALAQLASRISAAVRLGASTGDDVFAKVKSLITDMIAKLQKEAAEEAELKEYCDEETAKSDAKKGELTDDTDKLKAKSDAKKGELTD